MGLREEIYGYTYLKHIVELCPGEWEDQLEKINEVVYELNHHKKQTGNTQVVT